MRTRKCISIDQLLTVILNHYIVTYANQSLKKTKFPSLNSNSRSLAHNNLPRDISHPIYTANHPSQKIFQSPRTTQHSKQSSLSLSLPSPRRHILFPCIAQLNKPPSPQLVPRIPAAATLLSLRRVGNVINREHNGCLGARLDARRPRAIFYIYTYTVLTMASSHCTREPCIIRVRN